VLWVGVLVSLTLALAMCWLAWGDWQRLVEAKRQRDAMQAQLNQREQELRDEQARLAIPKPYAKDAQAILRIASFPSDQVLKALEATQIEGVKVTSIDLSPEAGTARVELEFTDQGQLMRYIDDINAGESKPRWVLQQAKMQKQGVGTAVLSSSWSSPGGPPTR
jgi:hypothetical protein